MYIIVVYVLESILRKLMMCDATVVVSFYTSATHHFVPDLIVIHTQVSKIKVMMCRYARLERTSFLLRIAESQIYFALFDIQDNDTFSIVM